MGALARTEEMAIGRIAGSAPHPERSRPRTRPAARRQASWNVLAEEIVPFPVPRVHCGAAEVLRRAGERNPTQARLEGGAVPGRVTKPSLFDVARPLTARAGDTMAHVGSRRVSRPRGLRRLLPGAATIAVLASVWVGAGALSGLHRPSLAIPAAAVKVHGGYLYTARPGDTLWSIASKLEPGGDPRILVAQLEQQLHGGELVAGDELKLP